MRIKESIRPSVFREQLSFLRSKKVLAILFSLAVYSTGLVLFSAVLHKEGFFGEILRPILQENIKVPGNYIKGLMSKSEHLTIDIKHKDYLRLAHKRKIALEEAVLHPYPEDFVPAKIRWKGKTIKVKMRLKGDLGDHWARDHKWSFRVKTRGKKTVMGMKAFSLQHPRTRGFMNDWHLHKMLEQFGFITLRYDFVDVTVNGRHLGTYAIEEHFEKALLDNNKRINGPIVRIKDHLLWYRIEPDGLFSVDTIDELYTSSPIDAFTTGAVNRDPVLLENFKKAKDLLELFRRGELYTHQVFDIDKLSKLFAIIDLFGYRHTTAYSNIRFYYNPVTSLLVPIGYDNTFVETADSIEGQTQKIRFDESFSVDRLDWKRTFFEDKVFFKEYMKAVKEISSETFLPGFFDKIQDEYDEKINIIYSTFPGYSFHRQKNMLYANHKFISKILDPLEAIQAYVKDIDLANGELTLQIGNIQLLPVEMLNISFGQQVFSPVLENENQRIIQSKTPYEVMEFREFKFNIPKNILEKEEFKSGLVANYRLYGLEDVKNIAVFQWSYLNEDFKSTDLMRQKSNPAEFKFIKINDNNKTFEVKQGNWTLDRNLIIPKGYTVLVSSNTQIDLINNAKIISYSPVEFQGLKGKPVVIKSSDGSGQGIAVIQAVRPSVINFTKFENLSPPKQDGWQLNASITFYESEVAIANSVFTRTRNGSALDIIRSKFKVGNSVFSNIEQDAVRVIFSKGEFNKVSLVNNKSSGVYISGSIVSGNKLLLTDIDGQAINVNNQSDVTFNNVKMEKIKTAFVSRDSSLIRINVLEMSNVREGFVAFNKKSEFGPARIEVDKAILKDVKDVCVVDKKSVVKLNNDFFQNSGSSFNKYN